MNLLKKNVPGLLLCLVIAVPSWFTRSGASCYRRPGIRNPDRYDTDTYSYQEGNICGRYQLYFKENSSGCQ